MTKPKGKSGSNKQPKSKTLVRRTTRQKFNSNGPERKFQNTISINSRGTGYVAIPKFDDDVEIDPQDLGGAFHNDTVEITLNPARRERRQSGRVSKVIERAKTEFIGTVEKSGSKVRIIPSDRRMYADFILPESQTKKLKNSDKVLVRFIRFKPHHANPEAELLKVLGSTGEHNVEMNAIILDKGFQTEFPKTVEAEAKRVAEQYEKDKETEIKNRRDFRDVVTFTIDPADAKDFDDAISFQALDGGLFEIGIHIADVSHFVTEGSVLDQEARKRSFSVYLVDRTIPMLPEILSNDLCSLNANQDKLAMSAVFIVDGKAQVKERWFGKTVINPNQRFSYEDAQIVLDGKNHAHQDALKALNKLAHELRQQKTKAGAIDFETDEVRFELDRDGKPVRIYKKERLDTHKLVEDFMLLANREVATYIYERQKKGGKKMGASLYRIHDVPDKDKLGELSIFLRALGYELNIKDGKIDAKDINQLLQKIKGKSEEALIKTAAIRSMTKAIYSTKNIGHFGLAFQYYTHFTSPIRRYPDLVIHRILDRYLNQKQIPENVFAAYEKIAAEASEKEVAAAEAERESIKYKQVEFMQEKIGQDFDGVISGVTDWGIYVEEKETKAEGMIRLRDLPDDYYQLDQKNYAVVGERTKQKYALGDAVRIKLIEADLDNRTLSFKLAQS